MRWAPMTALPLVVTALSGSQWPAPRPAAPLAGASVSTQAGAHLVVSFEVQEGRGRVPDATAALLQTNGRERQHVIVTPGVGRPRYQALVGPLDAGTHDLELQPSPHWMWPAGFGVADFSVTVVAAGDPFASVLAHAPVLGIRADTVGSASDLPLLMYVEDERSSGTGWLRYSVIFSNEDGGTPPRALMARWGRTTDIELAYEAEWRDGKMVQDRIQAPNHRMLAFNGQRLGQHPFLLVATLNNMFMDRGASVAVTRPVPVPVALGEATRESVMDSSPWMYRVMARELSAEGRTGTEVEDPREFLYVEAALDLKYTAVAAEALAGGRWQDSSRGEPDLAVARDGWVRIAVPSASAASALRWRCEPHVNPKADTRSGASSCRIRPTRAFALQPDYTPGPNRLEPIELLLSPGTGEALPLRSR